MWDGVIEMRTLGIPKAHMRLGHADPVWWGNSLSCYNMEGMHVRIWRASALFLIPLVARVKSLLLVVSTWWAGHIRKEGYLSSDSLRTKSALSTTCRCERRRLEMSIWAKGRQRRQQQLVDVAGALDVFGVVTEDLWCSLLKQHEFATVS